MFYVCQYCLMIQMCHTPKVLPVLDASEYLTALENISLFRRGLIFKFLTANIKIAKQNYWIRDKVSSPFFLAMIPNVPRHKMWLSVTEIIITTKVWYLDSLWYFYDTFCHYWDSKTDCREKMPFSWNGANSITVFKRDRGDQIARKEVKTNRKTKCQ